RHRGAFIRWQDGGRIAQRVLLVDVRRNSFARPRLKLILSDLYRHNVFSSDSTRNLIRPEFARRGSGSGQSVPAVVDKPQPEWRKTLAHSHSSHAISNRLHWQWRKFLAAIRLAGAR